MGMLGGLGRVWEEGRRSAKEPQQAVDQCPISNVRIYSIYRDIRPHILFGTMKHGIPLLFDYLYSVLDPDSYRCLLMYCTTILMILFDHLMFQVTVPCCVHETDLTIVDYIMIKLCK